MTTQKIDDTTVCACGHVKDEHVPGFISECTVKDCPCRDFEPAEAVESGDAG